MNKPADKFAKSKSARDFRRIHRDKPRELAFEIFREVIRNGAYSNLILSQYLGKSDLDNRDRAFITEIVYGSIRQLGRNDFIAAQFSNRPWDEVDDIIVDLIRIGAYQLFDMRIPTHAAVDSTVNLARQVAGESKASFVNALMRKLSSRTLDQHLEEVQDDSLGSIAIRFSHPEWIINSYRDSISDLAELKRLLIANNSPVSPTLVAWPTRSTQSDLIEQGALATKFSPYGGVFKGIPGELNLLREFKVGVQDEGSQILAIAFAAAASEHQPWLDLCAGPGGKAALLSYLSSAPLIANEISETRADLVRRVVRSDTKILIGDGREMAKSLAESGESTIGAVLADVPCTGLGAIRRRPEIRWRRTPSDLPSLTKLQFELAQSAITTLPVGGIFAYATCSPHIAETHAQCVDFMKHLPVKAMDVTPFLPKNLSDAVVQGRMQLWPHRHETDAMFLALFEKINE